MWARSAMVGGGPSPNLLPWEGFYLINLGKSRRGVIKAWTGGGHPPTPLAHLVYSILVVSVVFIVLGKLRSKSCYQSLRITSTQNGRLANFSKLSYRLIRFPSPTTMYNKRNIHYIRRYFKQPALQPCCKKPPFCITYSRKHMNWLMKQLFV